MIKTDKDKWIVYIHTSPNNKKYVGITCQEAERRWKNGHGYKNNEYFWNSIQKYGWDNFTHEIIEQNLSLNEANSIEEKLIQKYKSNNFKYGFNKSKGGDGQSGIKLSSERRKQISRSVRNYRKENPYTQEEKDAMAKPLQKSNELKRISVNQYDLEGNYINTFQSSCDAENCTNICQSHILNCCKRRKGFKSAGNYQWRFTNDCNDITTYNRDKEWYKTRNKENIGKSFRKTVMQYDKFMNYINTFDSITEASNITQINNSHISDVCKGKRKSCGGYIWKYKEEIIR